MNLQIPSVLSSISRFGTVNAGVINIAAGFTNIADIDLGLLIPGQILLASLNIVGLKGGTIGTTIASIFRASGTATVDWDLTGVIAQSIKPAYPAGTAWAESMLALGRVTAAGTYVIRSEANSAGSNVTVAAASALFSVMRFNR